MAIKAQFYSDTHAFPPVQSDCMMYNWHGLNESNAKLDRNKRYIGGNQPLGEVDTLGSVASFNQGKNDVDIDQFIFNQGGALRIALFEQQSRQAEAFLGKLECRVIPLLKKKDEEIAQAVKRTVELQDFLRRLEEESQCWQKVAEENEAMAMSMSSQLAEVREKASNALSLEIDDAQSQTGENRGGCLLNY